MTSAVSRSWKQTILDQNLVLFWSCSIYYRKPLWMVYIKGTDRFWVARVLPWKTWKWEKFSKSLSRYIVHPSLYFLKISRNSVKCVNLWRVNLWTTTVHIAERIFREIRTPDRIELLLPWILLDRHSIFGPNSGPRN